MRGWTNPTVLEAASYHELVTKEQDPNTPPAEWNAVLRELTRRRQGRAALPHISPVPKLTDENLRKKRLGYAVISAGVVFAIILAVSGTSSTVPLTVSPAQSDLDWRKAGAEVQAKEGVKSILRDPESARFSSLRAYRQLGGQLVVCGYVNAKNGFGGYTGDEAFIAVGTVVMLESNYPGLAKIWEQACH